MYDIGERRQFDPDAKEADKDVVCEAASDVATRADGGAEVRAGGGQGRQERLLHRRRGHGQELPRPQVHRRPAARRHLRHRQHGRRRLPGTLFSAVGSFTLLM